MSADETVQKVAESIERTYSEPFWGLKASTSDVVREVCEALDVELAPEAVERIGDALWEWQCDQPSPLTEGLASLVEDGLAVGATVPVAEIAGEAETEEWGLRQARFVLEQVEAELRKETP